MITSAPTRDVLIATLAGRDVLARSIGAYVKRVRLSLAPECAQALQVLFTPGSTWSDVGQFAHRLGRSKRSLYRLFCPLGTPALWLRLARILPVLLDLQCSPRRSMLSAVLEAGYSDVSTFNRQCRQLFGHLPAELREIIGWQWPLWVAVSRTWTVGPNVSNLARIAVAHRPIVPA